MAALWMLWMLMVILHCFVLVREDTVKWLWCCVMLVPLCSWWMIVVEWPCTGQPLVVTLSSAPLSYTRESLLMPLILEGMCIVVYRGPGSPC